MLASVLYGTEAEQQLGDLVDELFSIFFRIA